MATPLSTAEIEKELSSLEDWTYEDDTLVNSYSFGNFREAVSFIVRVGFEAEEMNHHPTITNVYNEVSIALTTHDAGDKVTRRDVQLAEKIDSLVWV
jgi:4a-hydroxytetrahydrobiopterin dehydratase